VVTAVTYRFKDQRGPHPHRAYLPGTYADVASAQAALQAVVGAVAKVELVGTVARIADELPVGQAAQPTPAEESAPAGEPAPVEGRGVPVPEPPPAEPVSPPAPVSSWRESEIELSPPPDPVSLLRPELRRHERRNGGKVDLDNLRSAFVSALGAARERRGLPKLCQDESYPIFDRALAAIRRPLRAVPPPLQRGSSPPIHVRIRHGARVG
jgi:hypothetical protein